MSVSAVMRDARHKPILALLFALTFAASVISCSNDDKKNPTNPGGGGGGGGTGSTSFSGVLTTGSLSGKLNVTIATTSLAPRWNAHRAARATVTATGSAVINNVTTTLSGTYDTDANTFSLSGGGYTFNGTYDATYSHPVLVGTWSGNGLTGEFVCYVGQASTNAVYVGQFNSDNGDSGTFSFTVVGGYLNGYAHPDASNNSFYFEGSISGTGAVKDITIAWDYPNQFYLDAPGFLDTAKDSVYGTYTFTDVGGGGAGDDTGNWHGKKVP